MLDFNYMDTSKKVIEALKEQGRSKVRLCEKLNMSRPTLDNRLSDNTWRINEVITLMSLLGIK